MGTLGSVASVPTDLAGLVDRALRYRPSDQDRSVARLRFVDTALAVTAGTVTPTGASYLDLSTAAFGRPTGSPAAALLGMTAVTRMTEIDDIDLLSCVTPGSIVVPAILALAGHGWLDGRGEDELMDAVAFGYQLATDLGIAIGGPSVLARGVWPTLAVGAITTAAVSARVLGGDDGVVGQAVGLAAMTLRSANPAGSAREMLVGEAAVSGLLAALSAVRGVSASNRGVPLAAEALLQASASGPDTRVPAVLRTAVKQICSARQCIGVVAGVQSAVEALGIELGIDASELDAIEVHAPSAYAAMVDKPTVRTRRESMASAQYQVAVALTDPARLLDVERSELGLSADARTIADKVTVTPDPSLDPLYPIHWPVRVVLHAGDVSRHYLSTDVPGEEIPTAKTLQVKLERFRQPIDEVAPRCAEKLVEMVHGPLDAAAVRVFATTVFECWESSIN